MNAGMEADGESLAVMAFFIFAFSTVSWWAGLITASIFAIGIWRNYRTLP